MPWWGRTPRPARVRRGRTTRRCRGMRVMSLRRLRCGIRTGPARRHPPTVRLRQMAPSASVPRVPMVRPGRGIPLPVCLLRIARLPAMSVPMSHRRVWRASVSTGAAHWVLTMVPRWVIPMPVRRDVTVMPGLTRLVWKARRSTGTVRRCLMVRSRRREPELVHPRRTRLLAITKRRRIRMRTCPM